MILWRLRVVLLAGYFHLKQISVDGFVLFTVIVQPVLVSLLAILLLQGTEGFSAMRVLIGGALAGLWSGTLFFGSDNTAAERWTGNLENLISSPAGLGPVTLGKTLANTVVSLASILVTYPSAAWLMDFRLTIAHSTAFAVSVAVGLVTFVAVGQLVASVMSVVRGLYVWANALEFPMYILGGFLFPVSLLPEWATHVSRLLSPYWAANALQSSVGGNQSLEAYFPSWLAALGLSFVYVGVAAVLFRVLIRKATKEGTLALQ